MMTNNTNNTNEVAARAILAIYNVTQGYEIPNDKDRNEYWRLIAGTNASANNDETWNADHLYR